MFLKDCGTPITTFVAKLHEFDVRKFTMMCVQEPAGRIRKVTVTEHEVNMPRISCPTTWNTENQIMKAESINIAVMPPMLQFKLNVTIRTIRRAVNECM